MSIKCHKTNIVKMSVHLGCTSVCKCRCVGDGERASEAEEEEEGIRWISEWPVCLQTG